MTVRVQSQDGRACLEVSDQGIGIPQAAHAHIFQPFYRAANVAEGQIQGIGIGLSVVKEIVARHGGEITVVSRAGEGSTFRVFLPLHTANPARYAGCLRTPFSGPFQKRLCSYQRFLCQALLHWNTFFFRNGPAPRKNRPSAFWKVHLHSEVEGAASLGSFALSLSASAH